MKLLAASFGAVFLLFSSKPSVSEDFVLRCGEPTGQRVDYSKENRTAWSEDGFRNMRPVVVARQKDEFVLVSWGSMIPDELLAEVDSNNSFEKAVVTHRDENQIQAINRYCSPAGNCLTELYGIFPKLGFVTRLDTSYQPLFGAAAARMFTALCETQSLRTAE